MIIILLKKNIMARYNVVTTDVDSLIVACYMLVNKIEKYFGEFRIFSRNNVFNTKE